MAAAHLEAIEAKWEREGGNLRDYALSDGPLRLQVALRILRESYSTKASYLSRCLAPQLASAMARRFYRNNVLPLLDDVLGANTSSFVKLHASLPTRLGGLGLMDPETQVCAAYYSSWNDVMRQVFDGAVPTYLVARFGKLKAKYSTFSWPKAIFENLQAARTGLETQINELAELTADTAASKLKTVKVLMQCVPAVDDLGTVASKLQERIQSKLLSPFAMAKVTDTLHDDQAMLRLGYTKDELDIVRAKAMELQAPGATLWTQALPVVPDFELPNEELRATLAHHLLLPRHVFCRVVGVPSQHRQGCLCTLGEDKPLTEQHLAGCGQGGHRSERHDRVVKLIASIVKRAGCSRLEIEPRGLRNYGDQRPDIKYRDATLAGKKKEVIVDVAVASTLPTSVNKRRKAMSDSLYKIKLTEQRKIEENSHRMTSTQRFVPMVMSSTGAYSKNVANLCRHPGLQTVELPSDLVERLTPPLNYTTNFVKMQLVMRVVKGTASNIVRLVGRICERHGVLPDFELD